MKNNKILRILGIVIVLSLLVVAIPVAPALAAGPISIYPSSGPVGTWVILNAYNFSANTTYTVTFEGDYVTGGDTGSSGNFTAYFAVPPYARGLHPVTVTTAVGETSITFYAITPTIALSTSSGHVGDQIAVSGTGFTASSTVYIYLDTTAVTTVPTTTYGTFSSVAFTVPDSSCGAHLVRGTDVSGDSPSVSFTTLPKVVVSPLTAAVGGQVTVSGTGFYASSGVTIYFDDEAVRTTQTNSLGTFASVSFTVPESYRGSHTIKVQDASGNYATTPFTVGQKITFTPTSGTVGTEVTVSGSGFEASTGITITFAGSAVTTTPAPVTTNSKGSFSASLTVPTASSGAHQIKASDGTNEHSQAFTVSASASLSQTSGYVGTEVTVSGTGFIANKSITITFADVGVGTAVSDDNGSFSTSFNVPVCATGTYKVKVSDGVNTEEADFAVLTSASISPVTSPASPGHVGTELTISGIGFIAGRTVTITYDGNQVATATVKADRTFSVTFKAPTSRYGEHSITATDGTITKQFTFTMESVAPPIPVPLKPEMGIKAKAQAYFDWKDVTDPSGVTYTLQIASDKDFTSIVLERKGLTDSEYTLTKEERLKSVSKKAPYYWHVKAIDGASNESLWSGTGEFYVGFYLVMPQWAIYTLFGIGALLFGFLGFWVGRRTAYYSY